MAILQLVDQMTELLSEGREVPLSRYRMIDAEEFSQILERMRISVPSSIRESERTLVERDNILAEARKEADKIIQDARDIAADMLSDNSLVVMARQESQRIIDDGREVARQRTGEADSYATQVLQELHDKLNSISSQVENGITVMTQGQPEQSYSEQSYSESSYPEQDTYGSTRLSHGSQTDGNETYGNETYGNETDDDQYSSEGRENSSTRPRINNPLTGRGAAFDRSSSYQDFGYSDSGYSDSGRTDSGFSGASFTDSGYSDSGQTDAGFSDRYQLNTSSTIGTQFEQAPTEVSAFDTPQIDNSQIDSATISDATSTLHQVDTKQMSDRNETESTDDGAQHPPTPNYLSNPSDSMSEHL